MSHIKNTSLSVLLDQYECLSKLHTQIDTCLQSINENEQGKLTAQLRELDTLVQPANHLFSEKNIKIIFFSTPKATLPHEIEKMLDEANEISTLREQLLNIHHRAS